MTSKEFRESKHIHYALYTIEQMDNYLQEYAAIKCQELLKIVAEKALVNVASYAKEGSMYKQGGTWKIDKDSIFNAVDLNEFIK